jgi:hypothetical protein
MELTSGCLCNSGSADNICPVHGEIYKPRYSGYFKPTPAGEGAAPTGFEEWWQEYRPKFDTYSAVGWKGVAKAAWDAALGKREEKLMEVVRELYRIADRHLCVDVVMEGPRPYLKHKEQFVKDFYRLH